MLALKATQSPPTAKLGRWRRPPPLVPPARSFHLVRLPPRRHRGDEAEMLRCVVRPQVGRWCGPLCAGLTQRVIRSGFAHGSFHTLSEGCALACFPAPPFPPASHPPSPLHDTSSPSLPRDTSPRPFLTCPEGRAAFALPDTMPLRFLCCD